MKRWSPPKTIHFFSLTLGSDSAPQKIRFTCSGRGKEDDALIGTSEAFHSEKTIIFQLVEKSLAITEG